MKKLLTWFLDLDEYYNILRPQGYPARNGFIAMLCFGAHVEYDGLKQWPVATLDVSSMTASEIDSIGGQLFWKFGVIATGKVIV